MSATQRLTPATLQGRVASAVGLLLFAPLPLAVAAGALLVGPLGYGGLFVGAAILTTLLFFVPLRTPG